VRTTDVEVWLWHLESLELERMSTARYKHLISIEWQTGFSQELLVKIMMGMNE
jgi:hypothetical protein